MKHFKMRHVVMTSFVLVPVISSLISTLHLVSFFNLGNTHGLAVALAVCLEIGALSGLLALTVLHKLNKNWIYFILVVIFSTQVVGNVFYTYDYVFNKLLTSDTFLASLKSMIQTYAGQQLSQEFIMASLSLIIGLPVPAISFAFTKSIVDYIESDKKKEESPQLEHINSEIRLSNDVVAAEVPESQFSQEPQPEILRESQPESQPESVPQAHEIEPVLSLPTSPPQQQTYGYGLKVVES